MGTIVSLFVTIALSFVYQRIIKLTESEITNCMQLMYELLRNYYIQGDIRVMRKYIIQGKRMTLRHASAIEIREEEVIQDLETAWLQVEILLKYKESVPDRTKITAEFGATGVHVSYMPAQSLRYRFMSFFFFLHFSPSPLSCKQSEYIYKYRNNIEGTRTVYLEVLKLRKRIPLSLSIDLLVAILRLQLNWVRGGGVSAFLYLCTIDNSKIYI